MGAAKKSLPDKTLNPKHPIRQIPDASLITIGKSGSANANEEFLAVLPDQLLNQSLRHLRPTLHAMIPRLANDLIKNCAIILDDDRLDACPTNIESDRCLRLHFDRFIEPKNRCN